MKLMITADDFGYCPRRNLGIVELFKKGKISRTTMLMNGRFAVHAVRLSKENQIPVGLHFNLTEGRPISATHIVQSLLNAKTGVFLGKHGFREALKRNCIDFKEVEIELEAQIAIYRHFFGHSPPFVDGHQHVHVIPPIARVFASCLKKNLIVETRLPYEFDIRFADWIEPRERLVFYLAVCQDSKYAKIIFTQQKIYFTRAFIGLSLTGYDMTLPHIKKAIKNVERTFGQNEVLSCEWMVHPGYSSHLHCGGCSGTQGPDEFSMSPERKLEMDVLNSVKLEKLFVDLKITVQGFTYPAQKFRKLFRAHSV